MRHALRSLCAALALVGPCVAGHGEALAQAPASGEGSTLGGAVSDDPATPAPQADASLESDAGAVGRRGGLQLGFGDRDEDESPAFRDMTRAATRRRSGSARTSARPSAGSRRLPARRLGRLGRLGGRALLDRVAVLQGATSSRC